MKVVIIGGVAGGATAAARLRRLDERAEIIILERTGYVSYANCGLPYYVGGLIESRDELIVNTPQKYAALTGVEVLTGREAVVVNYTLDTGLTFAVDEPAKVGRDRIADAAAAAEHYPLPCMTVDLGTATTYNVISHKTVFLGGFIVPGVQTSLRAISAGTAQLPPIAPEPPEHLIGANTVAALNNGAMFGTAAMLDGLADRVEAELAQPLTVVATGGLAPYIMPCCKRKIIYDADLLFKGLALIWERNGK